MDDDTVISFAFRYVERRRQGLCCESRIAGLVADERHTLWVLKRAFCFIQEFGVNGKDRLVITFVVSAELISHKLPC